MPSKRPLIVALVLVLLIGGGGAGWYWRTHSTSAPAAAAKPLPGDATLLGETQALLVPYRKIIVLLADDKALSDEQRKSAAAVGQVLFHEKLEAEGRLSDKLAAVVARPGAERFDLVGAELDYIESGQGLMDADRLAYRELLVNLRNALATDGSLPAAKLHKRVRSSSARSGSLWISDETVLSALNKKCGCSCWRPATTA